MTRELITQVVAKREPKSCSSNGFDDNDVSMRRSHHHATLTEAISEAVARFQADV